MKIKVSDLTPRQLNYAVASLEFTAPDYDSEWVIAHLDPDSVPNSFWLGYSTDAGLAYPIIERERITLSYSGIDDSEPCAYYLRTLFEDQEGWHQKGPTPLIAAMRCYVAAKLGDEVEIPEGV